MPSPIATPLPPAVFLLVSFWHQRLVLWERIFFAAVVGGGGSGGNTSGGKAADEAPAGSSQPQTWIGCMAPRVWGGVGRGWGPLFQTQFKPYFSGKPFLTLPKTGSSCLCVQPGMTALRTLHCIGAVFPPQPRARGGQRLCLTHVGGPSLCTGGVCGPKHQS